MNQPDKFANPLRGELNSENKYFPSSFAPENLVSRDEFSRPVPLSLLYLHTQAESGACLRDSSHFRGGVHSFI